MLSWVGPLGYTPGELLAISACMYVCSGTFIGICIGTFSGTIIGTSIADKRLEKPAQFSVTTVIWWVNTFLYFYGTRVVYL